MRFATLTALALALVVSAENPLPKFAKSTLSKDTPFVEFFDPLNWQDTWITSKSKKIVDGVTDESLLNYRGIWNVEEPLIWPGIKDDHALVVKSAAAHSAISVKFEEPIDPKGKDLVIQYEVKFQNKHDCGGAYMKLLTYDPDFDPAQFSDKSPYTIMFGPDKCGNTNKVHFIFRHLNPLTKQWEEKHMNSPPAGKFEKLTGLYTLIVHPDNTFEVLINNEQVKKGNLLKDFTPSVNPDKEIDDPNDTKPEDWVEDAKIRDPAATKPEDWDEDAPMEIEDMEATQPADWLSNEPLMIPDPEAEKPEDWDDEEDGDWTAPSVPNPACEGASGCGVWTRPMKKNPEYKGVWTAPMIDNPDFIGIWKPKKIENPNYFEDTSPSDFTKIGALGFELWTMNDGITFDNIYIGHSIADAAKLAKDQWEVKHASEKLAETESKAEEAVNEVKEEAGDYLTRVKEFKDLALQEILGFVDALQKDPVQGIKSYPLLSSAVVSVVVLLMTVFGLFAKSGDIIEKKEKKEKVEVLDKDDEVVDEKKKDAASPVKSRKGKKKDDDDE